MGVPSVRRMMKSSMLAFSNRVSPCTTSSHGVLPSGTRKRMVCGSPAAARASLSPGGTARHFWS